MNFFKKIIDDRKIIKQLKYQDLLIKSGNNKEAIEIINNLYLEYPDNFTVIYIRIKDLIYLEDLKGIDLIIKRIKAMSNEKIKSFKYPYVIQTDLVSKDAKTILDLNFDPIISDKDLPTREICDNPEMLITTIVRRNYYMCMKYNHSLAYDVEFPPKHIRFLAELNIKYCPEDKDWVLHWFYKEGFYAVERGYPEFAVDVLTEYIKFTKDNKDEFAHHKYYSRGLAYRQLGRHDLAIKDFNTSLKFTKDKELIKEVKERLVDSQKKLI